MNTPPASDRSPHSLDGASGDTRREQRTVVVFFALMLVFGLVCWLVFPHVVQFTKQWLARRHLPALRQHIEEENWQQASAALRDARRWAANDPAVIRAALDFIATIGGDPRSTISLVRQLQETGAATSADLALMGKMHLNLGETDKAKAIYAHLPPSEHEQRPSLELRAGILQADGFLEQAATARRAALQLNPDDPGSLRQLTRMDLSSTNPALRSAMRERLWRLARDPGAPLSLTAVELLAGDKELTVPQAKELLQLVETSQAMPARRETARFIALSARLRLSPHLRSDLIDQEIGRWKDRSLAQTTSLVAWLVEEREFARVLRMVPARTAARHTDLLPHYVNALRGERQWQELRAFLASGGIDPSFPAQRRRLWQAEAQAHLQPDLEQTRQTLARVYEEAGRGNDLNTTLQAAALAEQLNQWDLAQKYYAAVAGKHAQTRQLLPAKIYQMAEFQRDGPGMLDACAQWLVAQPDNLLLLTQKLYLQLLLGIELETARQQLHNISQPAALPNPDRLHLCRALAAYRHGQHDAVRDALSHVTEPATLPAGERTVYAALFKLTGGDVGAAFRLVERISPALLMPEEQVFLKRAL